MHLESPTKRIHGLDSLRSIAILLVLMYHYMVFVSDEASFGILSQIGWMGVDLFFVLSGYLIGNQIFKALKSGSGFSLSRFYIRRALRTLPNYYFVLALYFLFPLALGGKAVTPLWQFLSFTQNFDLRPGAAFSHAWSLCIEEQFYLILPVLALLLARLKQSVKAGWWVLLGFMCTAVLLRSWAWRNVGTDFDEYYAHIYYASLGRFDELLPGVALAMLKNFHPQQWQRAQQHGHLSLLAGSGLFLAVVYLFQQHFFHKGIGFVWFTTAFGYSLLAISFALLTLSALSPNSWLYRIRIPGAAPLALCSYALYLIHKPLMNVLIGPFAKLGLDVKAASGIALMFVFSYAAAYLMFVLLETPFMRVRQRYFPGNSAHRPVVQDSHLRATS